ncbi:MAG: hypothetical protein JWN52_2779 [Actinomycetia bacterium]|nr:hypothetical protein [Actinomycetes bacterium]
MDNPVGEMGGRAKVPARRRKRRAERRTFAVQIWLSSDEYTLLRSSAAECRMATGAFAAETLIGALRNGPLPGSLVPHDVLVALNRGSGEAYRIGANFNQVVAKLHATDRLTPDITAYSVEIVRILRNLEAIATKIAASIAGDAG